MKLSISYEVFVLEHTLYLANIDNGDLFEINDVVYDLINTCKETDSLDELCEAVYEKYKIEDVDYNKDDLKEFVSNLVQSGILIE